MTYRLETDGGGHIARKHQSHVSWVADTEHLVKLLPIEMSNAPHPPRHCRSFRRNSSAKGRQFFPVYLVRQRAGIAAHSNWICTQTRDYPLPAHDRQPAFTQNRGRRGIGRSYVRIQAMPN